MQTEKKVIIQSLYNHRFGSYKIISNILDYIPTNNNRYGIHYCTVKNINDARLIYRGDSSDDKRKIMRLRETCIREAKKKNTTH